VPAAGTEDRELAAQDCLVSVRTARSRILAAFVIVIAAVVGVSLLTSVPVPRSLALLGLPIVVIVVTWALYWRPRVNLDPRNITLVDVVRTVQIPWSRVRDFDVRFGLGVNTTQPTAQPGSVKKYSAWALPAAGRTIVRPTGKSADGGATPGAPRRPELRPGMPTPLRTVLDYRAQRTATSGALDTTTPDAEAVGVETSQPHEAAAPIVTRWNWGVIAALVVAVGWAVLAVTGV